MSELLKQCFLMLVDIIAGVLRSALLDMKHSMVYRVKESVKKRQPHLVTDLEPIVITRGDENYELVCQLDGVLIFKKICGTTIKAESSIEITDKKEETAKKE